MALHQLRVVGQLLVADGGEIRLIGFAVAARVAAFRLNQAEKRHRLVARKGVIRVTFADGAHVRRQAVNRECLTIGVLRLVQRLAVRRHRPVHAAALGILKMRQECERMARIAQQGFIARHPRRRRKCPQNAAVEDAALVCVTLHGQVMIHIAEPAAALPIGQVLPERQNGRKQMVRTILTKHEAFLSSC